MHECQGYANQSFKGLMQMLWIENYPSSSSDALHFFPLLAPQSGALRISAYRDFQSQSHPVPLIAFEHLSLSMVI